MGLFSRFEDKAEDIIEGGGGRGGIEPVKIAKKAAKEMQREKMIGVGHEYAPTLFSVLVSAEDDRRMGGYYPSLAGEIETYLQGRAEQEHLVFDCPPLVRFIVDEGLKRGRFDVIAENVSPAIIKELRDEELEHYGLDKRIDVNPSLRRNTLDASDSEPAEEQEFDPFIPADMQQAHYIPEDAPAHQEPAAAPSVPLVPADYQPTGATPDEEPPAPASEEESKPAEPIDADETILLRPGTVPNGQRACLYSYEQNRRYPLKGLRVTIGRGMDNDIVISDPGASRHHAVFTYEGDVWMVNDNNSTNGTYLNGESITKHLLVSTDVIELGTTRLEFMED